MFFKIKPLLVFLSASLIGFSAFSLTPRSYKPTFQCPETHPEYTKLLNSLRAFQAELKTKSECQELSFDLNNLVELLGDGRTNFLETITRNDEGVLDVEATEMIQEHSSSVTEQVATLISLISNTDDNSSLLERLFGGTNRCVLEEEEQFSAVQKITRAAYEATKLISKVAGPYGVPISIAADTMFGVIQGLQSFIQKSEPIDFDQAEKREFFAESLCLFAGFEAEIRKLNNPEAHLRSLESVREDAYKALNQITFLCAECDDLIKMDQDPTSEEEKALLIDDNSQSKNGSKSLDAKKNLEWIDNEISKFKSIIDFPTDGIGPRELQSIKIILSDFLLKTASPGFMRWYLNKARKSHAQVERNVGIAHDLIIDDLNRKHLPTNMDLPQSPYGYDLLLEVPESSYYLLYYDLNQKLDDTTYSPRTYTVLGEAFDQWKLTSQNLKIVDEYCNFFSSNLMYPKQVEGICDSNKRRLRDTTVSYQAFLLADLFEESPEMSVIGPFDFNLAYHMKNFPEETASYFVDADRLLLQSESGNSMNLFSKKKKTQELFPTWQEASKMHIQNLVDSFNGPANEVLIP